MNLKDRIAVLEQLGDHLRRNDDEFLKAIIHRTEFNNSWFTSENQEEALYGIAHRFLHPEPLREWLADYQISEETIPRRIGLVLAGNIPLAGFHDLLCIFVAGHKAVLKLSENDRFLWPYLIKLLGKFDQRTEGYFEIADRLKEFDAIIAAGNTSSVQHLQKYFGKYPNIIRHPRNSIAVLDGAEPEEELQLLGKDVFQYFGLSSRNVSKVYLPTDYSFEPLLEALHEYRKIILHSKYKNNFDYNYAMFLMNKVKYKANGCIILSEDTSIQSRIAGLHYEYYDSLKAVQKDIAFKTAEIQGVVARDGLLPISTISFGKTHDPELWDYEGGVDTMAFLLGL